MLSFGKFRPHVLALALAVAGLALPACEPASQTTPGTEHPGAATPATGDPESFDPHDDAAIAAQLGAKGLVGHMHAAVPDADLWVFTVRAPGDFFNYVDLSVVPRSEAARAVLEGVRRHDEVRLFGELAALDAPQRHLLIDRVEVVEAWAPPKKVPRHEYAVSLPEDLELPGKAVVKVHAVDAEGRVLVVEWRDRVLPVFVRRPELTKSLWRNDVIELSFDRAGQPPAPLHLVLDPSAEAPITVIDEMRAGHGEPLTLEGRLVLFPDSPQLMFDIYALQVRDEHGIPRNYTLVNFEDMAAFEAIRQKLARAWGDAAGEEARNKLVHPELRIEATGIKNVVSASQANPQLLLDGPDAIRILPAGKDE